MRRLLPALWAGVLLGIAVLGTPAPFAVLDRSEAGRVVGHIFAREAWMSLALAVLLMALERRRARDRFEAGGGSQFSAELSLVLGTVFCTVAGYFAIQPMLAAARVGEGALSFGQLHGISFGLFGLKIVLLLVLAWRAASPAHATGVEPATP